MSHIVGFLTVFASVYFVVHVINMVNLRRNETFPPWANIMFFSSVSWLLWMLICLWHS